MESEGIPLPKLKPQTLGEAIAARFRPNLPLLIGLFAAYVSGSLGLGLFSLVVIIWIAWFYYNQYSSLLESAVGSQYSSSLLWADREALKTYRTYIEAEERAKSKTEYETGEWLSIMLKKMWPYVAPQWAASIKGSLTWSLGNYVANSKSSMIKSIVVKGVDLGFKAPRIAAMSGQKAPAADFDFRLDADVVYFGEAFVKLEVTVGKGPITINVPITIDELWMKGKMRFDFRFKNRGGTFKSIATSFRTPPQIGFRIVTGKSLDLMDLPAFKDMIAKTVNESIKFYMVDPKSWIYEFAGGPRQPTAASAPNVVPATPETAKPSKTKEDVETSPRNTSAGGGTFSATTATAPSPLPADASTPRSASSTSAANSSQSQASTSSSSLQAEDRAPSKKIETAAPDLGPQSAPAPRSSQDQAKPPSSSLPKKSQGQFSSLLRSLEGVDPEEAAELRRAPRKKPQQQHPSLLSKPKPRKQSLSEDDSEFVVVKPPEVDGTLRVRIVEAVELAGGEVFTCDPYIVVECGGSSHKTDIVDSTSNPHWNNAEFEFSICKTDPGNMKVIIRVFDHDLVGADSKLGRAEIDLSSIIQRHEEELLDIWIPLTDADSGRVHVQLTYYPEYN